MSEPIEIDSDRLLDDHQARLSGDPAYRGLWAALQRCPERYRLLVMMQHYAASQASVRSLINTIATLEGAK